ncbi:MAG: hypothetical protein HW388_1593 [Dehalococcoidia bacterium]|nr:hypothetical protein [Dehalococcoidia bacterium]
MSVSALVNYMALGLLLGAATILVLALRHGLFRDTERPKYVMLDMTPATPPDVPAIRHSRINQGAEDRIVRLALAVVALYYALSRLGVPSVGAIALLLVGLYLALTAAMGQDPLYRLLRWDTRLPEHRGRR